jgi:hypothetical protein
MEITQGMSEPDMKQRNDIYILFGLVPLVSIAQDCRIQRNSLVKPKDVPRGFLFLSPQMPCQTME